MEALAYPVGGAQAFSDETKQAAREVGFRVAFTYVSRINFPSGIDPFAIHRIGIESEMSSPLFRVRLASAAATGRFLL